MSDRGKRKELVGTVVSDKMQKTVIVEAQRKVPHPKYRKVIVRTSKFHAHNDPAGAQLGDVVRMKECRPLSKTKRWRVVQIVRKAEVRPEES